MYLKVFADASMHLFAYPVSYTHLDVYKRQAIHRAHQEHVPNCMRPMLNQKIKLLSELTEHTIAEEIEPPKEILAGK